MPEWKITTEQLQDLYNSKVEEQKIKQENYFKSEFPIELEHLDPENKLEDTMNTQIEEAKISIDSILFLQASKEKLTALLEVFQNIIVNNESVIGEHKIIQCGACIKFLNGFYTGIETSDNLEVKIKLLNLIILFKKIHQFLINNSNL